MAGLELGRLKNMKILFTGGGTLGSVIPLLALAEQMQKQYPHIKFLWIGTKNGPERLFVENKNIEFQTIHSGKLRRYFDFKNFSDIFKIILGFFQSLWFISEFKPDLIINAGSFVGVPVIWAGKFLGKKVLIHQLDFLPSLSNKLTEKFTDKITVTWKESLRDFDPDKTIWTGSPVRLELLKADTTVAYQIFNFKQNLPVVLVLGGSQGSLFLNKIVAQSRERLASFCQIIHLTGQEQSRVEQGEPAYIKNYQAYPVLTTELKYAYSIADIIISRAGMGTLIEIACLAKPLILIPLPNTHQKQNADIFQDKEAAVVLQQNLLSAEQLITQIKSLLDSAERRFALTANISKILKKDGGENMIKVIQEIMGERKEIAKRKF